MTAAATATALELKGSLLPLMVLRVLDTDLDTLGEQLANKVAQAPALFHRAPLLVDVQALELEIDMVDLGELLALIKQQQMVPVALRGGNAEVQDRAIALGLGILPAVTAKKTKPRPSNVTTNNTASSPVVHQPEPPQTPPAKIINRPVRSGQQVVAMEGDLVVLSSVSPGAEVLATGNIHVYGALRGRALAGVQGDIHARIFCQQLDAELVAVAGQYQVSEEFDAQVEGQAAQVYLRDDSLVIEILHQLPR